MMLKVGKSDIALLCQTAIRCPAENFPLSLNHMRVCVALGYCSSHADYIAFWEEDWTKETSKANQTPSQLLHTSWWEPHRQIPTVQCLQPKLHIYAHQTDTIFLIKKFLLSFLIDV